MFTIMLSLNGKSVHNSQNGSALIYILIAIALLGALTMTFMQPSSQQTTSQSGFRTVTEIKSQVDTIRTAIQECVLSYQKGDASIDNSEIGTDPGARRNFPLKPNSSYFSTADIGPTEGQFAKDIRCPGNALGTAANNHAPIFSGASGKFMPPKPEFFDDWQYYNGKDGVFIWTKTNKTDAFLKAAMEKLDEQFSECEADIVNAKSSPVNLDSDTPSEVQCEVGYTCFRVRLAINTGNAVWNGDDENDEGACK